MPARRSAGLDPVVETVTVTALVGRAPEPSAPTRAEQRADDRARRRSEWAEARRVHQPRNSLTP